MGVIILVLVFLCNVSPETTGEGMDNSALLEKIKQFGFSEYEAKCYLALFERDSLAVSEVASLAGIPRCNAYEAMERLLSKGLSVLIPGKMKRYAVSDPGVLREKSLTTLDNDMETELENLQRKQKEIFDMKMKEIFDKKQTLRENMDTVVDRLNSLYKSNCNNGNPLDYMEIYKDPLQIHRKFRELISQAKEEIVSFSRPPYTAISESSKPFDVEQHDSSYEAIQRGAKVRNIYELPPTDEERLKWIEHTHNNSISPGSHDRMIDELPLKLCVIDRKIVMYTMEDPIQGYLSLTTLITKHSALAKSFVLLFEMFWEKANDYCVINGRKYYLQSQKTGKKQAKS
jgi:HTH-type transcriptional regulator, sugar sensing transcriptional regulator